MARPLDPAVQTLDRALKERTREGLLYERLEDGKVRCFACGHRCVIHDGLDGICRVRFNRGGTLFVPTGYVGGLAVDPIEKKPFFHVLPGASALSFGMLGCDYHCPGCQNWFTSQALRDSASLPPPEDITAPEIVALARARRTPVIVSTYNEPLITSEWAAEVFEVARAEGLLCGFVSNGNGTPEAIRFLQPVLDLYKVDLKGFRQSFYREMGGTLERVQATIADVHAKGLWLEIVTLLIPGMNDSEEELRDLCGFVASVSPEIPWHVTAFHKDYKMSGPANTTAEDLVRAARIGQEAGLKFVYAGNLPGRVGELENTACPDCGALLVERFGYRILGVHLSEANACPRCERPIPGLWQRPKRAV